MDATPESVHPRKLLTEFSPLTKGQYPVFNKYPKFIVDYQVSCMEESYFNPIPHEAHFNAFANRADPDQAALERHLRHLKLHSL